MLDNSRRFRGVESPTLWSPVFGSSVTLETVEGISGHFVWNGVWWGPFMDTGRTVDRCE